MNDYFPYFDGVILNPLLILQTNHTDIVFEIRKMPQVYGWTIHLRKSKGEKMKKKKKEKIWGCLLHIFTFLFAAIGVKRHYIPKIYKWVPLREKGVNDTRAVQ